VNIQQAIVLVLYALLLQFLFPLNVDVTAVQRDINPTVLKAFVNHAQLEPFPQEKEFAKHVQLVKIQHQPALLLVIIAAVDMNIIVLHLHVISAHKELFQRKEVHVLPALQMLFQHLDLVLVNIVVQDQNQIQTRVAALFVPSTLIQQEIQYARIAPLECTQRQPEHYHAYLAHVVVNIMAYHANYVTLVTFQHQEHVLNALPTPFQGWDIANVSCVEPDINQILLTLYATPVRLDLIHLVMESSVNSVLLEHIHPPLGLSIAQLVLVELNSIPLQILVILAHLELIRIATLTDAFLVLLMHMLLRGLVHAQNVVQDQYQILRWMAVMIVMLDISHQQAVVYAILVQQELIPM